MLKMANYNGNAANVNYACDIYNLLLDFGYINLWLIEKQKFTYTDLTGDELALIHQIHKASDQATIVSKPLWKPWHRYTKAIHSSGLITINSKKITSFEGLVGTIAHEVEHFFDYIVDFHGYDASFGHGDNSSVGKMDSVPYYIGNKAKAFIKELMDNGFEEPIEIINYLIVNHQSMMAK